MEDTLNMRLVVSDGQSGYDEIKKESYRYAKDTVKKGDSIDFLSFFCGVFALICMLIVLYFGTVGGFTDTMIYLMVLYVFIAIFSLCTPLQILISELLWNAGFKKRLAGNCGYEKELFLSEENVKVCCKNGEETYANFSECFFFETKNFIILNVTDRKLFPVAKKELSKEEIVELRTFCINDFDESMEMCSSEEVTVIEPVLNNAKNDDENVRNEDGCEGNEMKVGKAETECKESGDDVGEKQETAEESGDDVGEKQETVEESGEAENVSTE